MFVVCVVSHVFVCVSLPRPVGLLDSAAAFALGFDLVPTNGWLKFAAHALHAHTSHARAHSYMYSKASHYRTAVAAWGICSGSWRTSRRPLVASARDRNKCIRSDLAGSALRSQRRAGPAQALDPAPGSGEPCGQQIGGSNGSGTRPSQKMLRGPLNVAMY